MSLKKYGPVEFATLEAIRQTVADLNPAMNLENLLVDEKQVPKLEDLRISNEYKLVRCLAQLLNSDSDTQLLEVGDADKEIYRRLVVLHHIVHHKSEAHQGSVVIGDEVNHLIRHPTLDGVWEIVFRLATGAATTHGVKDEALISAVQAHQPGLLVPLLLAIRHASQPGPDSLHFNYTRRLMNVAASPDTDTFSQRLISMALNL
jgi:hypothetical protein